MIATMAGGVAMDVVSVIGEADLTFLKDKIFMGNFTSLDIKVLRPESSPYLVIMGDYFILRLRLQYNNAAAEGDRYIDTDYTHYKWGKWPPYAVFPGEYKIKFDGRELFKFYVIKMDVETDCEGLPEPYKYYESFIAKRDGTGENITIKLLPKDIDNAQVNWTCEDTPDDGIDSGYCTIVKEDKSEYVFIPSPYSASTGRELPLSYSVKAEISLNGMTRNITKIIRQDTLDVLRQEYEDMNYSYYDGTPARNLLSTNIGNATWSHAELADSSAPGNYGWFQNNILTVITNLRNDYGFNMTCVSSGGSGYRTPIRNSRVSTATPPLEQLPCLW